jgi:molecular chaperone DnaK (HSP70)
LKPSRPHLTSRTIAAVRKALRDARLTVQDVQGVVMVGGSTRMPQIQAAVAEFFGRAPLNNLNPDEVVAWVPPFRPTSWPATTPPATCCCWM